VSVMLSVTNNPFILTVIILIVVASFCYPALFTKTFKRKHNAL